MLRFTAPLLLAPILLAAPSVAQVGQPFSPPRALNSPAATDSTTDDKVALVADSSNRFVAAYTAIDPTPGSGGDRDIHVTRSHDGGASWSPAIPATLTFGSDGAADDREPSLAPSEGGTMLVYASDRNQTPGEHDIAWGFQQGITFAYSSNGFVNSDAVSNQDDDRLPCIAGSATTLVCVWQRAQAANEEDICFARKPIGAGWSLIAYLNTNAASDAGRDRAPRLATDGAGTWIAVWQSTENLGGAIGTDNDIFFARSTDDGLTWSGSAVLNSTASTDATSSDLSPVIACDRSTGHWLVVWQSINSLGGTIGIDNDIFCSRSTDGGATWSPVAPVNTDAATDQNGVEDNDNFPDVAVNQGGQFIVTWQRGPSPATEYDVYAARSDDLGVTWTAPVLANTNGATDSGADQEPRIAVDAEGNWLVAWSSNDTLGGTLGSDFDVLSTRFQIPLSSNTGTRFCYGFDGSGATRCPCGNDSIVGAKEGCLNSTGVGAICVLTGTTSISGPVSLAVGANMTPNSSALYFQGTTALNFGEGTSFGDGLRCVTGSVLRIGTVTNSPVGQSLVAIPSTGLVPGAVRGYQIWYRNAATFCTVSTFNLSSAFLATWIP